MTPPAHPPLAWLSTVLWPDDTAELAPFDNTKAEVASSPMWWASPTAADARILVPADGAIARSAVRRYHDGQRARDRLRSAVAETVVRTGPPGRLLLDRHRVVVNGDADSGVIHGLRVMLGIDELSVAISLAQPKSNRKPVLQLFDASAVCIGFAKLGWNPHTVDLVSNEAHWLRHRRRPPLRSPEVLHESEVLGRAVVVTTAISGSRWPRRQRMACPLDVVQVVAASGTTGVSPVAELAWTAGVVELLTHADADERFTIEAELEHAAARPTAHGLWHGDLTPWNMLSSRHGTGLIDWEFTADGVPLGFDVCHFHTQVAMELLGLDADDAIVHAASRAAIDLAALGLSSDAADLTWRLYLVELIRRTLLLKARNLPTDQVHQGTAALRWLQGSPGPSMTRSKHVGGNG